MKRKKEQLRLFLFLFYKAAEEALFEGPEEFKLAEDKSIEKQKEIVDGQDQYPI